MDWNKNYPDSGTVLGHPSQLYVLFFTEMWERFSYYGMRALLVLFLTAAILGEGGGGYGWSEENALELYALYTGLVYFTPMIGGYLADRFLGYRKAVIIGAFVMAAGHGFMALEIPVFFFLGLTCLIVGNGLFKPNISSMVGQLYKGEEEKKDGAYTIFYMGINAGAFLGILLCGYIGEKISWSYGFGLAMIFMVAGAIQFWLSKPIFGEIGAKITKAKEDVIDKVVEKAGSDRMKKWIISGVVISALVFILQRYLVAPEAINDIALKIVNSYVIPPLLFGSVIGIIGYIVTDPSLTKVEKDRVWVIVILTLFTVFFWWAFEQSGGSMTIFSRDYTDRSLTGIGATVFNTINTVLTAGALAVITWVLLKLFKVTWKNISTANIVLSISFIIIWIIVILMLGFEWGMFKGVADALGLKIDENVTEVQASWFSILNSFFIITLAPLFSKFWEMKIIKSGPVKFGIGLILVGLGFGILAFGSMGIPKGAETASVSMIFLVLAYLFHTMGELCVSPVGLSYVSKLAPVRLVGIMFGVWFIANFIANWSAGMTGSAIEAISANYGIAGFFLLFTGVCGVAGLVLFALNPIMKKMMHGVDD
ncbi:peptide MFS transporter [Portibacter lacus]|uniref:MFS transporter n=1 Tax=Portibacter lacus TaxID=1099794 RepID=A0AA37WES1_9BACT|nr:peptide MFS transporter [Portibacter lacus]GLR18133.1 MFS transporter [Portibacter lacus]